MDTPTDRQIRSGSHSWEITCLWNMLLSREGDKREAILMRQGKGWMQIPSMGHEALSAVAHALSPADLIFPCYRDRALMLARGVTTYDLALDFLGRTGSSSAGRNLPGHFSSKPHNVFSHASPTALQCLPAVGAAWGLAMFGTADVVLCNIGDAATRQGEFFEAVCFAVQESLPVVFMIQDNGYGISTSTARMLPLRLGVIAPELVERLDGRDPRAVLKSGTEAIARARAGKGPALLWCDIDRIGSHTSSDDHTVYRPAGELEEMHARDPLCSFSAHLIQQGLMSETQWTLMQQDAAEHVAGAYRAAARAEALDAERAIFSVYGDPVSYREPMSSPSEHVENMAHAVNRIFAEGLATFPNIIMFGEDIADPKGGVFGLTKGLSTAFPDRVFNSPLAEATIVGAGAGLAATGWRPVFEIQFIDFMTPGFNQLANQVATLRWRTDGEWTCPAVFYAPYGAYTPGAAIWHSQSNEAWWTHMPGLRVAVPSTPQDAAGLFWSAFQDEDPSLILIPKHLLRARVPIEPTVSVPFGQAAVRREGDHVTVVAWGNGVELALGAADALAADEVHVEVVDLRTLVPCDLLTVEQSLRKTGRLVVVQEDMRSCGFGSFIISEIVSDADRFYLLAAPPQLVTREDVHIPYSPSVEEYLLPSVADVVAAIQATLQ